MEELAVGRRPALKMGLVIVVGVLVGLFVDTVGIDAWGLYRVQRRAAAIGVEVGAKDARFAFFNAANDDGYLFGPDADLSDVTLRVEGVAGVVHARRMQILFLGMGRRPVRSAAVCEGYGPCLLVEGAVVEVDGKRFDADGALRVIEARLKSTRDLGDVGVSVRAVGSVDAVW